MARFGRNRPPAPRVEGRRRWAVGVRLSSDGARLAAALVGGLGRGFDASFQVTAHASSAVPTELARLFRQLSVDATSSPAGPALLAASLAKETSALIEQLLGQTEYATDDLLVIGVHDPGLWHLVEQSPVCYQGLCDAARLAASTGVSVVDSFPSADLAHGGRGGPVTGIAEWLLLRHPHRTRVHVNLGRTTRLTYLPAATHGAHAPSAVLSFQVGPGTRLLDRLVQQLTGGSESFDAGGRHAVQGRQVGELLAHWLSDPYFQRSLPRWHPWGVRPERFLADGMRMALEQSWSIRDLLCTATHLIAETTARAIQNLLPKQPAVEEVLLSGGGKQNGLLLRELGVRLPQLKLTPVSSELQVSHEAVAPACAAILALAHLDCVPTTSAAITGGTPCVLGRLTPGSRTNWRRVAVELHDAVGPRHGLRAAG